MKRKNWNQICADVRKWQENQRGLLARPWDQRFDVKDFPTADKLREAITDREQRLAAHTEARAFLRSLKGNEEALRAWYVPQPKAWNGFNFSSIGRRKKLAVDQASHTRSIKLLNKQLDQLRSIQQMLGTNHEQMQMAMMVQRNLADALRLLDKARSKVVDTISQWDALPQQRMLASLMDTINYGEQWNKQLNRQMKDLADS